MVEEVRSLSEIDVFPPGSLGGAEAVLVVYRKRLIGGDHFGDILSVNFMSRVSLTRNT